MLDEPLNNDIRHSQSGAVRKGRPNIEVALYYGLEQLDTQLIAEWRQLIANDLIVDNVYLSPDFVIPAIKHLTPSAPLLFVAAYEVAEGSKHLVGLGIFVDCPPSLSLPFRSLQAYNSLHSLQSGVLLRHDYATQTFIAMLQTLKGSRRWKSVGFENIPQDLIYSPALLEQASEQGIAWHEYSSQLSSSLSTALNSTEQGLALINKRTRKSINRNRRKLISQGDLEWQFIQGHNIKREHIDDFLTLEHNGWKKEQQSSLLSNNNERQFFVSMFESLATTEQAFICQVLFNGKAISSSCNMISGSTGFAFKIGYDPTYSQFGIGVMNEFFLVEQAASVLPQLTRIDSGSEQGSYIDSIWKDRITLYNGQFSLSRTAAVGLQSRQFLRDSIKKRKPSAAHS